MGKLNSSFFSNEPCKAGSPHGIHLDCMLTIQFKRFSFVYLLVLLLLQNAEGEERHEIIGETFEVSVCSLFHFFAVKDEQLKCVYCLL